MLMAAWSRSGANVEVDREVARNRNEKETDGAVAALFGKWMLRNFPMTEADGIPDLHDFTEVWEERPEDDDKELKERTRDAEREGFASGDIPWPEEIIHKPGRYSEEVSMLRSQRTSRAWK